MSESFKNDEQINGGLIAARILNRLPRVARERLVYAIEAAAPSVLEKIEANLVSISDISKLPQASIKALISKAEHKDLMLIAQGSDEVVRKTVFQNLPEEKISLIRKDLEVIKNASESEVEEAQRKIVSILEEIGEAQKKPLPRAIA